MPTLPDRPDLRQLRIQAKELKRALAVGDPAALERVHALHPKFAGRPPERLESHRLTLRDAQATIARELGFESWRALLLELEGAPRWDATVSYGVLRRASAEAIDLHHAFTADVHLLLALLKPPATSPAAQILQELGLTYEEVRSRVAERNRSRSERGGTSSTPTLQLTLGWAQGIAIGMGAASLTDDHVLLALVYGDFGGTSRLVEFEIDPDDVVDELRSRGIPVPSSSPPTAPTPVGPAGSMVYFPQEDWQAVSQLLSEEFPPGAAHWGTNASRWKPGHWYVIGEDDIPMEAIVRRAVKDQSTVEVVLPSEEAASREDAGRARDEG